MAPSDARSLIVQVAHASAPGEMLRSARLSRSLKMRDVVFASNQLAGRFENREFHISLSHLSQIEVGGALPNLYRLCSLAMIYELDLLTLASWFIPELAGVTNVPPGREDGHPVRFPEQIPKKCMAMHSGRLV